LKKNIIHGIILALEGDIMKIPLLIKSVVLISLFFLSCATNPTVVNFSHWEVPQENAVSWLDAQHIESSAFRLRRTINNSTLHFSYEGNIFDYPVYLRDFYFQAEGLRHLTRLQENPLLRL